MTCDPSTPTIREATQQDAAAIARLAEDAGMGTLTPRGTSYVALLFVARGPAVPFYTALGCEQVERERISPDLGEDCDTCPDFAACRPVPMIYR